MGMGYPKYASELLTEAFPKIEFEFINQGISGNRTGQLFAEALKTQPEPKYYSADGVHPNANGAALIGKHYAEAVQPLIESL